MPRLLTLGLAASLLSDRLVGSPAQETIPPPPTSSPPTSSPRSRRRPDHRVSDQQIRHIDAGGHNVGVGVVQRPPTTSLGAIQHHNQTEVYYVVSGRGTMVTGGELTNGRELNPDGVVVRTLTGTECGRRESKGARAGRWGRGTW